MGMPPPTSTSTTTTTTRRPISDIDLPELPDFLRPDPTTKRPLRPIQDIDLPEGTGVIQPIEEDIQEEDQNKKEEKSAFREWFCRIFSSISRIFKKKFFALHLQSGPWLSWKETEVIES